MRDSRLVGSIAEDIFLSLLNEQGVFAASFDTVAFDGVVYDNDRRYFKVGDPPFYVQIKCRGSNRDWYNPQGHAPRTFGRMREVARELDIPETSLYFVAGFFKSGDVRTVKYYCFPLGRLDRFKGKSDSQYRFSVQNCRLALEAGEPGFRL